MDTLQAIQAPGSHPLHSRGYWVTLGLISVIAVAIAMLLFAAPYAGELIVLLPIPGVLIFAFTLYMSLAGPHRSYPLAVFVPSLLFCVLPNFLGRADGGFLGLFWFFVGFGFVAIPLGGAVLIAHAVSIGMQRSRCKTS